MTSAPTESTELLEMTSPLWEFAISFWQSAGVEEDCLALQQCGWPVTRLICAGWLTSVGAPPAAEAEAVTDWRDQVTARIRTLRQSLARESPALSRLRNALATAELEAEQIELALAYQGLSAHVNGATRVASGPELARAHFYGAAPTPNAINRETEPLIDSLINRLIQHTQPATETIL